MFMTQQGTIRGVATASERRIPLILSVDDDPEISSTIAMRLRDYDVRVKQAFFGIQGFWEAVRETPDLILLDMAMPQGNGQFVLECLKRNQRSAAIPVIVLSGARDPGHRNLAFQLGAVQFMRKPVEFVQLLIEMRRHVDLRESTTKRVHRHIKPFGNGYSRSDIKTRTGIQRIDLGLRESHD